MNKVKVRRGSKAVSCPKCKTEFELEYGRFNSGAKGNSFESFLAKELTIASGVELSRTPCSGGLSSRWPHDLYAHKAGENNWDFGIEAKFRNGWTIEDFLYKKESKPSRHKRKADQFIWDWWNATVDDAKRTNKIPVLIIKRNKEKPLVVVRAADFGLNDNQGLLYKGIIIIDFEFFKGLLREWSKKKFGSQLP